MIDMLSSGLPILRLKPGREKSLLRRHPWIYSGAVAGVDGTPGSGETVVVRSSDGRFMGLAGYSPNSQIRARVWSFDETDTIGNSFFQRRLDEAVLTRSIIHKRCTDAGSNSLAYRLVHAESDGLPGFILDKYAETLVLQVLSAGAERWREVFADLALEITGAERIFERSDVEVRELEGLPLRIAGLRGGEPPDKIAIIENGIKYWVDVRNGHKTGFYLDQRANRLRVREYASDRDVLDCFCYTGGMTANVLAGGAKSVLAVDASKDALVLNRENIESNNLPVERVEYMVGDVFQLLRKFRDSRRNFDMIILDPPKFAPTAAQAERAARGYKDINLLAFKLLRPGGILVTFSCSGGVSAELFQSIVAGAALDAGVNAQILEHLYQDVDHPVALSFPEGAYLKGFVIRIM
jgi:23S rRNA (cytosine1962-C5)-methyltransferase